MENSVIVAIPSLHVVITTIVYALIASVFFEIENALGEGIFVVVNNNDKTMKTYSSQQAIDTDECKSPCPESAEMCIEMCA